jgi:pimeloyl-ACP methyl ester carboxylesterase
LKKTLLSLTIIATLAGCGSGPAPVAQEDLEEDAAWESATVNANGINIHYWRTGGEGKPVIIMAHGITDYGLNYASLAKKFEDQYDIIMYDARGHGHSDKPEDDYSVESHVEDLVGLIKALGIEKPILMGHSMGGGTVSLLASKYPDLPRAVILEDPAGMLVNPNASPEQMQQYAAKWTEAIVADKAMGKEKLIELVRTERHPGWTDADYDGWAEAKMLVSPNVAKIVGGTGFGDSSEIFPKITAPTLILKADAEPDERKKHLAVAELLPNGRLVHIDGAGHVIRLDEPEATEREVRAFLESLN